jgi:hypothetical protein
MKFTEQKYRELIRTLDAAYSVGGREALSKMTALQVHALHAEKMVDLRAATAHLRQYPHDELGQARLAKAERDASDIAGFLKAEAQKAHNRDMELEQ